MLPLEGLTSCKYGCTGEALNTPENQPHPHKLGGSEPRQTAESYRAEAIGEGSEAKEQSPVDVLEVVGEDQ